MPRNARPARRSKRKGNRRSRMPRQMRAPRYNTFSETFIAANIIVNTSGFTTGLLNCSFGSLSQAASYSQLYRKFRILKTQWTLIPRFNSADLNSAVYNSLVASSTGWGCGRLIYAIDDTPGVQAPTAEIDLLQSNGAKIRQGQQKVVIVNRPKPNLVSYNGISGVAFSMKGTPWLNTDNNSNTSSGTTAVWGAVRYTFAQPVSSSSAPTPFTAYDVFCKVTFQVCDPA